MKTVSLHRYPTCIYKFFLFVQADLQCVRLFDLLFIFNWFFGGGGGGGGGWGGGHRYLMNFIIFLDGENHYLIILVGLFFDNLIVEVTRQNISIVDIFIILTCACKNAVLCDRVQILNLNCTISLVALDSLIEGDIKKSIVFLLECSVCSSMQWKFPSLSIWFCASVNSAYERLLVSMRILMFSEILRQREHFATKFTWKCLLLAVYVVVPLQREFRSEALPTERILAFVVSEIGFLLAWLGDLIFNVAFSGMISREFLIEKFRLLHFAEVKNLISVVFEDKLLEKNYYITLENVL